MQNEQYTIQLFSLPDKWSAANPQAEIAEH